MFASLSDPATSNQVNSLTSKFIALCPVVYLANTYSPGLKMLTSIPGVETAANLIGVKEVFAASGCSWNSPATYLLSEFCSKF